MQCKPIGTLKKIKLYNLIPCYIHRFLIFILVNRGSHKDHKSECAANVYAACMQPAIRKRQRPCIASPASFYHTFQCEFYLKMRSSKAV